MLNSSKGGILVLLKRKVGEKMSTQSKKGEESVPSGQNLSISTPSVTNLGAAEKVIAVPFASQRISPARREREGRNKQRSELKHDGKNAGVTEALGSQGTGGGPSAPQRRPVVLPPPPTISPTASTKKPTPASPNSFEIDIHTSQFASPTELDYSPASPGPFSTSSMLSLTSATALGPNARAGAAVGLPPPHPNSAHSHNAAQISFASPNAIPLALGSPAGESGLRIGLTRPPLYQASPLQQHHGPLSPAPPSHASYVSGVVEGTTVTIRSSSSLHPYSPLSPGSLGSIPPPQLTLSHPGHSKTTSNIGAPQPREGKRRGGAALDGILGERQPSTTITTIRSVFKGLSVFKLVMLGIGALLVTVNIFLLSRYTVFSVPTSAPLEKGDENGNPLNDDRLPGRELDDENGADENDDAPPRETKNRKKKDRGERATGGSQAPPATLGDGKKFKDDKLKVGKIVPYEYDTRAWEGFTSMDDIIRRKISKKYWGPSEQVVETSAIYRDHEKFASITGCDLLRVPFDPSKDEKCINFMLNRENWKELRPLPMEYDQRTVKFEIEFKPVHESVTTRLATIIKVPQRMFPYEAFSEAAAFHADRIFKIDRVPPTTILWLPLDQIQVALDTYGDKMSAVDEFLKESKVNTYREWVEKDFLNYTSKMKWHQIDESTGKLSVPISMQLRVADVGHMLDTTLSIPYKSHNTSWHRFFDLLNQRDSLPDGEEEMIIDSATGKNGQADDNVLKEKRYEQLLKRRPIFMKEKYTGSIVHISELATFDMVIGNDDRSPNKNNFVVGGCKDRNGGGCADVPVLNALKHPGPPTFIHLDQGMAFYSMPKRSALYSSIQNVENDDKKPSFCMFRTPQLNRLRELAALSLAGEDPIDDGRDHVTPDASVDDKRLRTLFHKLMAKRLPPIVKLYVDSQTLRSCSKRLHKVIKLAEKCLNFEEIAPFVLAP